MEIITSAQNTHVKTAKTLHERKYRREQNQCLVIGDKAIGEAQEAGLVAKRFFFREDVLTPKSYAGNAPFQILSSSLLTHIAQMDSPPPVVGIFSIPDSATIETLEELPQSKQPYTLLVIDGVQDPGNMGTLFRSAVAFGVYDVLVIKPAADVWQPKVIRSSTGLQFRLNIVSIKNHTTLDVLNALQEAGWTVTLADASDDLTNALHHLAPQLITQPLALVLGQEGQGLRLDPFERNRYETISIPMQADAESLNVAISGSIIMQHLYARRHVVEHS